ncbi:protein kinase domain-containing protein [Thermosynechococcus sp. FA-CM-4201]
MTNFRLLQNRYQTTAVLSECGGFGITYRAVDKLCFDQPCVVKQLRMTEVDQQTLPILRQMFEIEALQLHRLGSHPQIPALYAHFEEDQNFFIVQEFIDGTPLSAEIREGEPWSSGQVRQLLLEILQPLKAVHDQQVIHRDLKPDNLLRRHSDRQIVIIDFGAVKELPATEVLTNGRTRVSRIIGTPAYMPVEQFAGRPKFASDIYAVGIIALQALTGCAPDDLVYHTKDGELDWRSQLKSSVDETLASILDRMVCYDYRDRFQSVAEVLEALDANKPAINLPSQPLSPALQTIVRQEVASYLNPNRHAAFTKCLGQQQLPAKVLAELLMTTESMWNLCAQANNSLVLDELYQLGEGLWQQLLHLNADPDLAQDFLEAVLLPLLHCRGCLQYEDSSWSPHVRLQVSGIPRSVLFSPSGELIAAGLGLPPTFWLQSQYLMTLGQFGNDIRTLALSHDGQWLAIALEQAQLKVWHRLSDRQIPLRGQTAPITCLAFHPHLPLIASGGQDRALRLWHVEEQAQIGLLSFESHICALAWSPDGHWLACGLNNGTIRLVDAATPKPWATLGQQRYGYPVQSLVFALQGGLLISGGHDGCMRIWQVPQQREVFCQQLMAPIEAVVLSADQSLLASGSEAGTLRLWYWQDQGQGLLSFARIPNQRLGAITSLAMHPRGKQIAAAHASGLIQIWEPDPQVSEIGKN